MDAKEFVKKFGWEKSKTAVMLSFGEFSRLFDVDEGFVVTQRGELKTLVDAYELVQRFKNRHGGIRHRIRWGQYRYGDTPEFNNQLKQAIKLVESVDEND